MKLKHYLFVCLSLLGFASCSEKDDTVAEYANWQAKNEAYFEQAYQDIRRYPFLPEDYKVMAIDPSVDETFVSIEMPESGRSVGVNSQIFMIWNKETKKGRFFGIKMDQGNRSILMEALPDHKLRVVSPAPESGTEMNTILTLVRGE